MATVRFDPGGGLGVAGALQRAGDFAALDTPPGNLGRRSGAAWLRVPVRVPARGSGRRVLEVDHAPLDLIGVHVLDGPPFFIRPDDAKRVGHKVLRAFQRPFEVIGTICRVGLTVGDALAPRDDRGVGLRLCCFSRSAM